MKTEPSPELVEMIDDEVDLFGDRAPVEPVRESRRTPHWVGPVAAAMLLAVVGYNVATSVFDDAQKTKADPNQIKPEFLVADTPKGFDMYLAEARGQTGTPVADFPEIGPAQLWATSDASATTGSWFVVSQGTHHATGRNSYRIIVDGLEVVVEHGPASGQSRASFTRDGEPLEITAFGWVDRQLVRLVGSVRIEQSVIHFSDLFFASGNRRILDADPATALFGEPVSRVGYSTAVPPKLASTFTITVAADHTTDRATVNRFALTNIGHFALADRTATVGRSSADPTMSVVQWSDGTRLITLAGNVGPDQLSAIARTVHQSSASAVHQQLAESSARAIPALQIEPDTIRSGMLADGWAWAIQVSNASPDTSADGYLWWIAQPGDSVRPGEIRPSLPTGSPTIETIVEHGRTYVLAKVPRSMAGAELLIRRTGLPSTVTYMFDVDAKFADEFTASVFDEPVSFTAQIVDRDGATVAFWPST